MPTKDMPTSNGSAVRPVTPPVKNSEEDNTTNARFDALVQDRDNLRAEVTQLRKSLEELQQKHESEVEKLEEQLEETQGEKDHAESQYRNLLGKVNTIKSQLGERLKADAVRYNRLFICTKLLACMCLEWDTDSRCRKNWV